FGEEPGAALLVNLLIPFAAYLLAEEANASGILAAVAAGITMSYVELTGRVSGSMRVQRAAVWGMLQFSFNGIMFVLLGEQLPGIVERAITTVSESGHHSAWWLLVYVVVINLALVLLRLAWVWLSLRWSVLRARHRGEARPGTSWRIVVATSLAGVR
ncbi:cation:proton antiporter, partial [Stenotrophomonas sp. HMWF003]|uniref:cation:proton antiporter domain-containing protein n=2 Tax=unclassified Stenotrophomonas TaxID=196198 RepID=UPI002159D64C